MANLDDTSYSSGDSWINTRWRPAMAWMYMIVCIFDFIIFPILWSSIQVKDHGVVTSQWQPLTLINGGFFHLTMGAVVGISAYGRTKEKINNMANNQTAVLPKSNDA